MTYFRQSERINVVYCNGAKDRISPILLDTLLDSSRIDCFERAEGWVKVGVDPLREMSVRDYQGIERRRN